MFYSPRLKRILNMVLKLEDGQYLTIDAIAASLKISRRTVFRELENINDQLSPIGLKLESRAGKGIRLSGAAEQKAALAEALGVEDVSYVNKEERRRLLAFELLQGREVHKLIYYANMFQVSEATVSHDIEALGPLFEKHGIHVGHSGKSRIEITGSESARRRAMTRIVHEQMPGLDRAEQGIGLEEIFLGGAPEGIMSLLNQDILRRVLQVFELNRHELDLDRFSQPAYVGLILHLVIAVERILNNESIEADQGVVDMVSGDASFKEAMIIAGWLEKEFDIEIPQVETAFITMHLQGSKAAFTHDDLLAEDAEARDVAEEFIDVFDGATQVALRLDGQLMTGLVTHLSPTLTRIRYHLPIYNPLLEQLKSQYAQLFEATRQAADQVGKLHGLEFSDQEVGFLTMHVGAALERNSLTALSRPIRVGIVCASGIGVSALLAARVQKQFQAQLTVRTLSLDQVRRQDFHDSELLLSTFALPESGIDTIQVSPLLSDQDVERIRSRLKVLQEDAGRNEAKQNTNDYAMLLKRLGETVRSQQDVLSSLVCVQVEASDAEGLLLRAADILDGDTAQIHKDLAEREKLGSVIAEDYGFAMYHAASKATDHPQWILMYPGQETFQVPGFEKVHFIAAALIPESPDRGQRETISLLSAALIENDAFLRAALARDRQQIEKQICEIFRRALEKQFHKL